MGRAYPQRRGTSRGEDSEVFVGVGVAKVHHAVAVAEAGRGGEVWWPGSRSGTHGCTSATKPVRRSMGFTGN